MSTYDEALTISNPRLLTAVYFSLLAIIATLTIEVILYALGVEQLLPTGKAIVLAVVVASIFGALFGERIVHSEKPYHKHVFLWAFVMVIVALPFYNLGFIYLYKDHHAHLFAEATVKHIVYLYLLVLVYSFILAGVWLAIFAGLAALYLRGYLVYYLLHSLYQDRKKPQVKRIDNALNDQTMMKTDDIKK